MNPFKVIALLFGIPFYMGSHVSEMTSLTGRLYHYFYNDVGHYYNRRTNDAYIYHALYVACTVIGWAVFLGILYLYYTGLVIIDFPYYMDIASVYIVAVVLGRVSTLYVAPELIGFVMGLKFIFGEMCDSLRYKDES